MISRESILLDLQLDLVGRALSDPFIGSVAVMDQRKGDVLKVVAESIGTLQSVAGKVGACVILLAPIGDVEYPNAPGGPLMIEPTFRVLEDPLVNNDANSGTLKSAEELCRRIVRVFHLYRPGGLASALVAKKPTIVPVADLLAPVAYEVRFECVEETADDYDKVQTPTLSAASGAAPQTVTVTCGTAGAEIYYTTDGTYPRVGNGILYATPVDVASAAVLRCAAYKVDCVASDVAAGVFT